MFPVTGDPETDQRAEILLGSGGDDKPMGLNYLADSRGAEQNDEDFRSRAYENAWIARSALMLALLAMISDPVGAQPASNISSKAKPTVEAGADSAGTERRTSADCGERRALPHPYDEWSRVRDDSQPQFLARPVLTEAR